MYYPLPAKSQIIHMNTIGFYLDKHRKSEDFVCFMIYLTDQQHTHLNMKNIL